MRNCRILLVLIGAVAVLLLAEQSASADCSRVKPSGRSSCLAAEREAERQRLAKEKEIKAQQHTKARQAQEMADEIAAEKAAKAKRDAEPGVTTQTCQLIKGELVCGAPHPQ